MDVNTALAKVEALLRRVLGEDIVMTITQKALTPLVCVDPGQMEQIIMNLALCDVILGDMSGPAVAEALQALRPSIPAETLHAAAIGP